MAANPSKGSLSNAHRIAQRTVSGQANTQVKQPTAGSKKVPGAEKSGGRAITSTGATAKYVVKKSVKKVVKKARVEVVAGILV